MTFTIFPCNNELPPPKKNHFNILVKYTEDLSQVTQILLYVHVISKVTLNFPL